MQYTKGNISMEAKRKTKNYGEERNKGAIVPSKMMTDEQREGHANYNTNKIFL